MAYGNEISYGGLCDFLSKFVTSALVALIIHELVYLNGYFDFHFKSKLQSSAAYVMATNMISRLSRLLFD